MIPDEFKVNVGGDKESPVPVHITVDDKVLGFGVFAIFSLLAYARIKSKK